MKRLFCFLIVLSLCFVLAAEASASEISGFDDSIEELKAGVSEETRDRMSALGLDNADLNSLSGLSLSKSLDALGELAAEAVKAPLSACVMLLAVILIAALLEGYTYSLRYADMRDVMNVVTSLTVIAVSVTPVTELIGETMNAAQTAANLMLIYAPLMVGMLVFGGKMLTSGGYYATVVTASEAIARLSSTVLAPLLHGFLALSVSSALSERVRLSSICELLGRVMKWTMTLLMTVYTAVLSLQSFAAGAADSVASKTVRFTLSSFIPIVGASISEAYRTLGSSLNLLSSGVGVFAAAAVILTFLPLLIRVLLWQLATLFAKAAAETFGVSTASTVLGALSTVLSVLTALIAVLSAVLLISSGAMLAVGGSA